MAKELIRSRQFCKAQSHIEEEGILSDEQKLELSRLYDESVSSYKKGTITTGKVLEVRPEGVVVDISFKSEGLVPHHEFTDHELKKLGLGSIIDVLIDEFENVEGNVVVSYQKAKALKAWDALLKLYEEGKPVEGVVTHKVKGGLSVDIGIPAFLPGSQVDTQRVSDFDHYIGQTITACIIKVNPKRGNVIISRRKHLNEQRSETRKKILDGLEVGQIIPGVVKNITNYGAFIDIGGVDGLLHITDMTWGRISHPSEILKIGDTITVKVLSFDKTNEKISLGLKQLEPNPWEKLDSAIQVGSKIKGTISSITDYGLFVEVDKGVEGLVHISEISWNQRISDLAKHYKVGDEIEAMVASIDKENRRMSLSVKQLEKNPWDAISDQFTVGQKIVGKITNVTDFGIFVQIVPGVDGLVHISDISWTEHIKNPVELYNKGDEVEVIVIDINKAKKKISLSIKHLSENPWDKINEIYPVGSLVEGEVIRLHDSGGTVRLHNNVEAFVHISELSPERVEKVEDVLTVGQKAQFRVIRINPEEHKISLSLKLEGSEEPRRAKRTERRHHEPASSGPKPKSQLQLELERHAARLQEKEEDSSNE